MATLHTVNKSPFESATFETCLGLAKSGSTILLIEDGVFAEVDERLQLLLLVALVDAVVQEGALRVLPRSKHMRHT